MKNNIMVIHPYKEKGAWVFDDESKGLVKEPFVNGIPEIIEKFVGRKRKFTVYFSASDFPNTNIKFKKMEAEYGGNWYKDTNPNSKAFNMEWLCPALLKYFQTAPAFIYGKVEF